MINTIRAKTHNARKERVAGAWTDCLLALGLAFLALPLALHDLGAQSLWLDEGTTQAFVTSRRIGALVLDLFRPSQAYPLYHLILKLVTRALGDSEWALRLPSAIAGGLAPAALYLLGVELRGRSVGLAAAALLLIAPWGLRQAQDAKAYSLALLTTILLALLFARALRLGSRGSWLAWAAIAALAPFVHRLLLLSLLACAVCWALYQRRARRRLALSLSALAGALLLGALVGSLQYHQATSQFSGVGPLSALGLTFAQFSVGQFAGAVPLPWLIPFGLLLLLGAVRCGLDLWGSTAPLSGERGDEDAPPDGGTMGLRRRRGATLLIVLGGLPLILFLLLLMVQPLYEARYLVGVYPFWLLLQAWAVASYADGWSQPRRRLLPIASGVILIATALVVEQRALVQPEKGIFSGDVVKEDFRRAVTRLAEHVHPDDLVIVHPDTIEPLYDYYARRVASYPLPEAHTYPQLGRAEGFGRRELDSLIREDLARYERAWLLVAPDHARLADPPAPGDELGLVGLAFQYADQNRRIQCGEQPYAGFTGLRLYCNNLPDVAGAIPQPATKVEATFGGQLRLRGYTITPFETGLRAGGSLPITLFWEPLRSLEGTDYVVFLHLTSLDDPRPLAQTDGRPMEGGQPTSRWTEPHALLHDERTIALPSDLPPGSYLLRAGLYRAEDGTRLEAQAPKAQILDDAVVLGEVRIAP